MFIFRRIKKTRVEDKKMMSPPECNPENRNDDEDFITLE
jgi:hypothetical protein